MKKKPAAERRNAHIFIRLTKDEKRQIKAALAPGQSLSDYARPKLLGV